MISSTEQVSKTREKLCEKDSIKSGEPYEKLFSFIDTGISWHCMNYNLNKESAILLSILNSLYIANDIAYIIFLIYIPPYFFNLYIYKKKKIIIKKILEKII